MRIGLHALRQNSIYYYLKRRLNNYDTWNTSKY
jgi:hypothetical protein